MERRDFLQYGSLLLAATASPSFAFPYSNRLDPVRIGIIGTGQRGTGLASVIQGIPDLSLIAGADILDFRLSNCMEKFGDKNAKSYSDYRSLLDNKSVDAVIVSSPLYLHKQMVVDALDAGKHVYCEKTMAYNIEQSLAIATKVKNSKSLIFQVGYQYRDFPLYHKVKEVLQSGWLGEVKYFETFYNRNNDWRREVPDPSLERQINWRMYREYSGGLMAELCSHQVDIVNWMIESKPERIMGMGDISHWKDGRETFDHINLVCKYSNGISGQITSHIANAHMGYSVKLMGTSGTVEINFNEARFYKENIRHKETAIVDGVSGATKKYESAEGGKIPVEIKKGYSATTYALESFAQSIQEGSKPKSNIDSGLISSIQVGMANQAMRGNKIETWKNEYDFS